MLSNKQTQKVKNRHLSLTWWHLAYKHWKASKTNFRMQVVCNRKKWGTMYQGWLIYSLATQKFSASLLWVWKWPVTVTGYNTDPIFMGFFSVWLTYKSFTIIWSQHHHSPITSRKDAFPARTTAARRARSLGTAKTQDPMAWNVNPEQNIAVSWTRSHILCTCLTLWATPSSCYQICTPVESC